MSIERIGLLLSIACIVSLLARRYHLPYTVGLVLTGVGLAASHVAYETALTKQLIYFIFLPPLIFEAAFNIPWVELRRDLLVIVTLSIVGVALSAAATTAGMHYLVLWDWRTALLFGVLIAATDPVSVIATFREAGVTGRMCLLVESESLFNDGTAAVAFTSAYVIAQGGTFTGGGMALAFGETIFGGILSGGLVAGIMLLLAGRTKDYLLEMAFTVIAAYGSFLLAEHFHCSGVMATLTAGLLIGNFGSLGTLTHKGRDAVELFWEFVAFVVNSLIFLLIGLRFAQEDFTRLWMPALGSIVIVTAARAIAVYPCCALFARSRWRVPVNIQNVLFWGGLRGALALALVLGLPANTPHLADLTTAAFAVVAFSVVVQGLTMKTFLRRVGNPAPETQEAPR